MSCFSLFGRPQGDSGSEACRSDDRAAGSASQLGAVGRGGARRCLPPHGPVAGTERAVDAPGTRAEPDRPLYDEEKRRRRGLDEIAAAARFEALPGPAVLGTSGARGAEIPGRESRDSAGREVFRKVRRLGTPSLAGLDTRWHPWLGSRFGWEHGGRLLRVTPAPCQAASDSSPFQVPFKDSALNPSPSSPAGSHLHRLPPPPAAPGRFPGVSQLLSLDDNWGFLV